ncbi:MYB DOMAIN PROTEIN 55 [Salix viminalis]|uniref:MYB DOMAIN PROTEIN 55 n=1 Tax=Salix viminalis TaxID=40686 RepID=A0A9Q0TP36_SALVM|nr:MYB DOMAIN PROTEIN 55 [Salix viminalis]
MCDTSGVKEAHRSLNDPPIISHTELTGGDAAAFSLLLTDPKWATTTSITQDSFRSVVDSGTSIGRSGCVRERWDITHAVTSRKLREVSGRRRKMRSSPTTFRRMVMVAGARFLNLQPPSLIILSTIRALPEEAFLSLNVNPNLILTAHHHDHHQLYLPSPTSILQSFGQGDFKFNQPDNFNVDLTHFSPADPLILPPLNDNSSSFDPLWSLPYLPQHLDQNQEDHHQSLSNGAIPAHYIGEKVATHDESMITATMSYDNQSMAASMMPRIFEIIEGNIVCSMPPSSESQDPAHDPLPTLSSLPSGSYPVHGVATRQLDSIDAIMSSLSSSSSTSSSSSSSLSPFSSSQFLANPHLPSSWDA